MYIVNQLISYLLYDNRTIDDQLLCIILSTFARCRHTVQPQPSCSLSPSGGRRRAGHRRHSPRSIWYSHCLPAAFLCSTVERDRERDRDREIYTAALPPPISRSTTPRSPLTQWQTTMCSAFVRQRHLANAYTILHYAMYSVNSVVDSIFANSIFVQFCPFACYFFAVQHTIEFNIF